MLNIKYQLASSFLFAQINYPGNIASLPNRNNNGLIALICYKTMCCNNHTSHQGFLRWQTTFLYMFVNVSSPFEIFWALIAMKMSIFQMK